MPVLQFKSLTTPVHKNCVTKHSMGIWIHKGQTGLYTQDIFTSNEETSIHIPSCQWFRKVKVKCYLPNRLVTLDSHVVVWRFILQNTKHPQHSDGHLFWLLLTNVKAVFGINLRKHIIKDLLKKIQVKYKEKRNTNENILSHI